MRKNSHFSGQPLYGQVIKLLDKSNVLQFSREKGGERYTKRFNCWIHLAVMLYAVIMRFDSLREITASLLVETRKLSHLGISFKIGRSTLADANKRRSEAIFESIYRDLYAKYRHVLSSDSNNFFSFFESIMDVFKAFPMINYKSECLMYSFTSENV